MPRARAREEDEHPEDRERCQHDHDRGRAREEAERDPGVVDVVDRERAGDLDLLAERERPRDDLLRQLVGADGGDGDRAEPEPLARSRPRAAAPRRRSAAARSSTSRRGCRAASGRSRRAGSVTAPASSRRRCTASSRGPPRAARPGSASRRPCRCRTRPSSIRCQRGLDLAELILRILLEPLVELALVGLARRVGEVVVRTRGHQLARRLGQRRAADVVVRDRVPEPVALLLQLRAEPVGVDAHHVLLSARRGEPSLDLVRLDAGQLDDLVS